MRHIRRYFALLFITATLLSALHEVIHNHQHDIDHYEEESCFLYVYAQTPTLLSTPLELAVLDVSFDPFKFPALPSFITVSIPTKNRSPPHS